MVHHTKTGVHPVMIQDGRVRSGVEGEVINAEQHQCATLTFSPLDAMPMVGWHA
ncbi:hypothetical protein QMK19_30190 [Streptomyces sp. H10-C2]|uniref:hypothetical protein n=1 Tax=unclassified Streptomyces TaxID=2593676 RepID=UPI0024BAFCFC|nr:MULTISPECIES: hypothetical protein [unclassified Streptomyces]MDJ0344938.1 hypothetical protein [Streptomyces sp. PH10-H1]MDJ0373804.1 hypothetical protein [Streptomyces sp. H10-C2]